MLKLLPSINKRAALIGKWIIGVAAIPSKTSFLFTKITALGFILVKPILDTSIAVSIGLSAQILVVFNVSGQFSEY